MVTGSYDNSFISYNTLTQATTRIESQKNMRRRRADKKTSNSTNTNNPNHPNNPSGNLNGARIGNTGGIGEASGQGGGQSGNNGLGLLSEPDVNVMDFGKKSLHVAWHPLLNTVAVAGLNRLYIYDASITTDSNGKHDPQMHSYLHINTYLLG